MASTPPEMLPDAHLQAIGSEHAEAMNRWLSDPELAEALGVHREVSLEETSRWIARAVSDPGIHAFAVLCGGEHVGNVVLDQMDEHLSTVRLSIYIGDSAQRGRGLGDAAVALALDQAFERLGVHKVWLTVHVENERAIALYGRCGFEREGVLKGEFLLGGRRIDAVRMAAFRAGGKGG